MRTTRRACAVRVVTARHALTRQRARTALSARAERATRGSSARAHSACVISTIRVGTRRCAWRMRAGLSSAHARWDSSGSTATDVRSCEFTVYLLTCTCVWLCTRRCVQLICVRFPQQHWCWKTIKILSLLTLCTSCSLYQFKPATLAVMYFTNNRLFQRLRTVQRLASVTTVSSSSTLL